MKNTMNKLFAVMAASTLFFTAVPAGAQETSISGPRKEETSGITVDMTEISASAKDQTYNLDQSSALLLINTESEPLVLENCTFKLSQTLAEKNGFAGKIFVQGNVEFKNCTFAADDVKMLETEDDLKEQAAIQLLSGAVLFEGCTLNNKDLKTIFLNVEKEADVHFKNCTLTSKNADEQVFTANGGTITLEGTKADLDQAGTIRSVITLQPAFRLPETEEDEADGAEPADSTDEENSSTSAENGESAAEKEAESILVPSLHLIDSALSISYADAAAIEENPLDETASDDPGRSTAAVSSPVVLLEKSTLNISHCMAAASGISLQAENGSSINSRENVQGMLLQDLSLNDSDLNIEESTDLSLELEQNSSLNNNSALKIASNKAALDTILDANTVLEVSNSSSAQLGILQTEDNSEIQTDESSTVSFSEAEKLPAEDEGNASGSNGSEPGNSEGNTETGENPAEGEENGDKNTEENGSVSEEIKDIESSAPAQQPEAEVAVTNVTMKFISLSDKKEIQPAVSSEVKDFTSVQEYVYNYPKGINGWNYVKYEYEMSQDKKSVVISLFYQEKEKYSVAVNYIVEGSTVPIHFSNVLIGLTEGEKYDVSRFNAIDIKGYTYVRTVGALTGTAKGADPVINVYCYYKKNEGTVSNDTSLTPEKGETVHTSANIGEKKGLYIGIAAGAVVLIGIIAAVLLHSNKKK